MLKKIFILILAIGLLFGATIGVARAENGDEPEPPPRGVTCDVSEWENLVIERLAAMYEVSTDEITNWFCQGYGFGEIALAYEISLASDYSVDEIFAMRAEGMGWGEIMQEVGLLDEIPFWRDRIPFPVPGRIFQGRFAVGKYCMEGDNNPQLEKLAEIYGLTYEQVQRWICGPFDYSNFDWGDEGWMDEMQNFEYRDGVHMRLNPLKWVLPKFKLEDLPSVPDRDSVPNIFGQDWPKKGPSNIPKGRHRP
jgi:hypothetical protein